MLPAVGQVSQTDLSGVVYVHWSDGGCSSCYPQEIRAVKGVSNACWLFISLG